MNLVRTAICLVSLVALAPAFGQEISYTAIEPTVNAASGQCIDYPPLDDGFGWNGQCRCLMEPEWTGFGKNVAISGDTLAIGAVQTPERCPSANGGYSFPPSTSVSIYEKSASGSWIKETEFKPYDGAGFNSFSFDDDGNLHIGRKVYDRINSEWQLLSTLDAIAGPYARTSSGNGGGWEENSQRVIFGDIDLYGNETVQGEVQIEGPGWTIYSSSADVYGDIALADTQDEVFFFGKNSAENWQLDNRIPFRYPQFTTVFQDSIIVLDLANNLHRWIRDQNGAWVKFEVFATNLPYPYSWQEVVPYQSDNRLLLTTVGHFRSYALNSENKLVESDRLELPAERGGQWRGIWGEGDSIPTIEKQVAFDGAQLLTGDPRNNIVYVFDGVFGEASNAVPSEAECDYSNADLYDGWGWNATTSESCQPVISIDPVATTQCIDSDGDGFGWDGRATCILIPTANPGADSNCDYSDADLYGGWGWNATASQSCAPLENMVDPQSATQCVDTDGDGWGWNSTTVTSCRI